MSRQAGKLFSCFSISFPTKPIFLFLFLYSWKFMTSEPKLCQWWILRLPDSPETGVDTHTLNIEVKSRVSRVVGSLSREKKYQIFQYFFWLIFQIFSQIQIWKMMSQIENIKIYLFFDHKNYGSLKFTPSILDTLCLFVFSKWRHWLINEFAN